jgi:hypothetical protein
MRWSLGGFLTGSLQLNHSTKIVTKLSLNDDVYHLII